MSREIKELIAQADAMNIPAIAAHGAIKDLCMEAIELLRNLPDVLPDAVEFEVKNEADAMKLWRMLAGKRYTVYVIKHKESKDDTSND